MSFASFCKILFLLWMTRWRTAMKLDCGEVERNDPTACQGENITLKCPKEKPWMQIKSAVFGRDMPEENLCPIPKNSSYRKWSSEQCSEEMAAKVTEICANQFPCVFNVNNVTFHDPCPHLYKYMWVVFECSCRRRYTRTKRATSTCIPKKPNKTSSTYTIIHPTPIFTTIRQSMSQTVTNLTTQVPIRMTVRPTRSISALPIKTSILVNGVRIKTTIMANALANNTLSAKRVRERKTFFLLLELFAIYNEAANEEPPMALMWCFIGILFGLFIITITFLTLGLRKRSEQKKLFRLSELETEECEIQSPTIHTTSQFPDSSDLQSRQAAVKKLNAKGKNGKPVSKHFPGMGSWSDLLKTDTSLYINPLWRGWREEYLSLTAQGEETELDNAQDDREGLTRSEPWNLSGAVASNDVDHCDGQGNSAALNTSAGTNDGDGSSDGTSSGNGSSVGSSKRNSNNSENGNQENSGSNLNDSNIDIQQSKPSTSTTSRAPTNTRRSVTESEPNLQTSIPVGIPSHPVPDPKIFHTEPTRTKEPEVKETTPKVGNTTKPVDAEHTNHLNERKLISSANNYKNPSKNLLSKFGIDSDDVGPTSRVPNTALSSPCLLSDEINQAEKHESSHHLSTNPGLQVLTRSIRSRSLDYYTPPASLLNTSTTPPHNSATTNNLNSQTPTMNKNNPSLWPKVLVDEKQNEQTDNVQVTKRQSKPLPDSRASSGYYSNNTSPLVEYPANITSSQNPKKAEPKFSRKQSLQRQKSLNSDDDLPPLPPPPPPLIPISPLPHMCVSGYREGKTKNENILDKNPCKPAAVRKVHFKSSE